ncbi:sigma-70 family RNA polymerase sigma factor [Sphingobacterium sp. lm-10]|uniref:sigma-70 family RNA polymerase sigma factor n=1 Tax=Sphingobacterium sp. lm-10 TaxID=2944904 RepID=UPI0020224A40|nr:sigma-70 family RNA polymerase sigma factor [Sphingobacterium sp. lm-10]MCL7987147.1 sigma-70 family RNA polymerase sigma factor [Sphingobacterium sp. lm-10]
MNEIHALQSDNELVFNRIYEDYHPRIYSFILSRTKSTYLAEEVTQLTFIKFWKSRDALSHTLEIHIQLFGMARQVMIDLLRKEAARFKYEGDTAETPLTNSLINAIESKDILQIIEKDIESMPKMRRLVFELSRKHAMSHREIADMFSISTKAVEKHIGKALGQLKQHLYSVML